MAQGSPELRAESIDPIAVARQARRLARAAEPPWLHAQVAARMAERLAFIKQRPTALWDLSAWLGASDAALKAVYPEAKQLWHCEQPALVVRSHAALARTWWQKLQGGGLARWSDGREPADLVWANMLLHACPDLPQVLRDWHARLAVGGFVMFACLGPDTAIELRTLYKRRGWGRPAPAWWDMHDLGDLMVQSGFADPVMDQERLRLTWADAESALADLRALGGNLCPDRFAGLRGRNWRAQLLRALDELRDADGRIALSLELVYGHAFKAAPRLKLQAETTVSVQAMREALRGATPRPGKV